MSKIFAGLKGQCKIRYPISPLGPDMIEGRGGHLLRDFSLQPVYSNFDNEHDIEKLYLASQNNTNNNAHQNLTCTFDPSDKTCTVCTTPHNILAQIQQSPLTFVISDQGFPGILSRGDALCVKTVRIEDGTLVELSNLFLEMFQGVVLLNSTIVLLGSVTSMLQQGSS